MGAVWPDRLGIGDRVRFGGHVHTITVLDGRCLTLVDAFGAAQPMDVAHLVRSSGFAVLDQERTAAGEACSRQVGPVDEQARWWYRHVMEVLHGLPPDASPGVRPKPAYDPAQHSLSEREAAKAEELSRTGVRGASVRTVRRKRQRYQAEGLAGLADGRSGRRGRVGGRWDPRVLQALQTVVESGGGDRQVSVEQVRREVTSRLRMNDSRGELVMPSRSAFHRMYSEARDSGLLPGVSGSGSPPSVDIWPGRRVVVDMVRLAASARSGASRRELVAVLAVDVDAKSLLTAVLRDGSVPLDGAALLARMCVPPDLRPFWATSALSVPASPPSEPHGPVIRPATIVIDRAAVPGLRGLRDASLRLGIRVQQGNRGDPHKPERSHVEHMVRRMASLLTQHLDAVGVFSSRADWPLERVQQAVDDWAVRVWPEVDLFPWRQPYTPHGRTPAARFTKLTAQAGWIAVPLPPEEFIALLPATKRVVGRHGLRLMNRWYDSAMLNALRRSATPSGNQGPFEVRWEPYDSRQVWVRSPELGWIPVPLAATATRASSTRSFGGEEVGTATPLFDSAGATNKIMARTTGSVLQAGELKRAALRLSAAAPILSGRQRVRVPSIDDPDPVRVAYHAQLPIYTTGVQAAVQRAEELIVLNEHAVDARYGLILHGVPGSGKTTVLTELAHRYMGRRPTPSPGGGVITVRLPPATTPRMLLGDLARALDTPVPARATTAELIRQVGGALLGATVGLVLVDEVHHLHTPAGSAVTVSDALDYLCDHSPATFVFAGIDVIPGAASEITRNPYRRLMPIPLGFMAYDEAWRTLVSGVEKMLRLRQHAPGTLPHLAEHLHELTDGGGHRLAYLMRSGAIRAIHDGTEAITRERLDNLAAPWHTGRS